MNPGLLPPPGPPHDPRSILLNGRTGFSQIPPGPGVVSAVTDAECCAITLPLLASAARDLAESSGSLGGIRPPSNVALGPDDGIFLLDRATATLRRFDPCTCAFTKVPCLGGVGGGPRQVRSPGGIVIARGDLYICDTGIEAAAPADPCGDQATLDLRAQKQNHRVSVFSLRGFALRGHLKPPPDQPLWRPVSVAMDSLGGTWVGDAAGLLHRFTRSGAWERSWPMVPAPAHLAIDCHDRVYVVAPGAVPAVRVLDRDATPVARPPLTPAEARRSFPQLPFEIDALGRLWLEPLCDPRVVCKPRSNGAVVFDLSGARLDIAAASPAPIYQPTATYRAGPLDSSIAQCVWHRVQLFGRLPLGTRVRVRTFASDEVLSAAELDLLAAWKDAAVADKFDDADAWDCLVRSEPGRYLWLELVLEGGGTAAPSIGAIVLEFPRVSLRRFLPGVFGFEPVSADFTDRFLALFDTPLRGIERQVDGMARLFDPASAPASASNPRQLDFLSWLGTWIGITLDRNWDVEARRRFLKGAGALFDRRGTVSGLRQQLLLLLNFAGDAPCAVDSRACGRCSPALPNCAPPPAAPVYEPPPLVLEHFRLRRWLRLGQATLGDEAILWGERIVGRSRLGSNAQVGVTRLDTTPDPARDPFLVHANRFSVFVPARCREDERTRKALENLVKTEAPADTRGYVQFVEPRFRIGIQSMLGFDAVVGAIPQGVTLGSTPLGGASILTGAPNGGSEPGIAVGKNGRIGTTARLA